MSTLPSVKAGDYWFTDSATLDAVAAAAVDPNMPATVSQSGAPKIVAGFRGTTAQGLCIDHPITTI